MTRIAVLIAGGAGLATAIAQPQPASNGSGAAIAPAGGRALFTGRCGYCHLEGGTGTMMLERHRGKAQRLLAERSDLDAAYVKAVVRNGINSMPALTRVEVTDQELDRIAAFLATPKAPGARPEGAGRR